MTSVVTAYLSLSVSATIGRNTERYVLTTVLRCYLYTITNIND